MPLINKKSSRQCSSVKLIFVIIVFSFTLWTIFVLFWSTTSFTTLDGLRSLDWRTYLEKSKSKSYSRFEEINSSYSLHPNQVRLPNGTWIDDNDGGPYLKNSITVVAWDSMSPFGWDQNPVWLPNYAGWEIHKEKCPVDCRFTSDRTKISTADAVLFDVCLTGPTQYKQVPIYFPEKFPGQKWIWFAYEQQYYFPMMQISEYMDRFDYRMTYHHDALVQTTFTCPWGMINTFLDPPPKKTLDKFVVVTSVLLILRKVFMASNCHTGGADKRTEYVRELMQYIKVDSYGGCLHNTDIQQYQDKNGKRSHGDKIIEKIGIISEYKFLLAFENTNMVSDYVTEKMTNAIQAGTVPVYWGSDTIDNWTPGPHSIIKASDFASPRELANYLTYLNENDEAYYSYFEWKKSGLSPQYQRLLDHCIFFAECRLCKKFAMMRDLPSKIEYSSGELHAYALKLNCLDCRLDTKDQFVQVTHSASLSLTNNFTLMAWINLNHIQDGRIIDKAQAGTLTGYSFDVLKQQGGPHGKLRLCAGSGCFTSTRNLSVGIWYHVAAVFSIESGVFLYINGKLDSRHVTTSPATENTFPVRFGLASAGARAWRPHHLPTAFDGLLDDVSIWNISLSSKEVWNAVYRRFDKNENGLAGYWGFNEDPNKFPDTALDSSKHSNHGRVIGNPIRTTSVSKPLNDASMLES